jgi:hypothetical protein
LTTFRVGTLRFAHPAGNAAIGRTLRYLYFRTNPTTTP